MATSIDRRQFLKSSSLLAGLAALPQFVPSRVLGADGHTAPSKKITIGCIGVGSMGGYNMKNFLGLEDCRVVAVCDVLASRRKEAKENVDAQYGDNGCAAFNDFRELLARKDIDAVMIATPDHWHPVIASAAAAAGKDIYCEKPMGFSHEHSRKMRDAIRRHNRVFQAGTWQRSGRNFRHACELAINGYLGKVHTVEVSVDGPQFKAGYSGPRDVRPAPAVPAGFDWKMWQGPVVERPYHPARHSPDWFMIRDYSDGWIVNWGVHHMDIALWGCPDLGTVPCEVECKAVWRKEGFTDTAYQWSATYTYDNGLTLIFKDQYRMRQGCRFYGEAAWVHVDRERMDAGPLSLTKLQMKPTDKRLYESKNHVDDFLQAVRSRRDPVSDVDSTHRASWLPLLADIAARLEAKLKWDPKAERFIGNDAANAMLTRPLNNGWTI
jgi:predicted dehydrogenase